MTVCHLPPGNQENKKEITIGLPALDAHLNHGDMAGSCDTVNEEGNGNEQESTNENDNLFNQISNQIANLLKILGELFL